ncbi:MAG: carboxypeptidase regulatory-like domain-containing protein [Verrucomicrobiota bacterium]
MNRIFLLISALCAAQFTFAGDITGTVHAEPKAGADENQSATRAAYASRKFKFVERVDYAAMRDFVVYLEGKVGTNATPTNVVKITTTRVAQNGAVFTPHILPVVAGTIVEWPNQDDIFHNVFSDSDAKKFDLELYKGNPPEKRVTFNHAGKVDVYCSIHANMHCVVLVMENPYFSMTDAGGFYTISNVPAGTYKLKAWHERLPADEQEIVVSTNGVTKANFTLTIKNLPKY